MGINLFYQVAAGTVNGENQPKSMANMNSIRTPYRRYQQQVNPGGRQKNKGNARKRVLCCKNVFTTRTNGFTQSLRERKWEKNGKMNKKYEYL